MNTNGYKDDADELECNRLLEGIMLAVAKRVDLDRVVIAPMLVPVDHWFGDPMIALTRNLAHLSDDAVEDLKRNHNFDGEGKRMRLLVEDIVGEINDVIKDGGRLVYRPYRLLRSEEHHYRLRYSKRVIDG